jgi:hypothetical protein
LIPVAIADESLAQPLQIVEFLGIDHAIRQHCTEPRHDLVEGMPVLPLLHVKKPSFDEAHLLCVGGAVRRQAL